MSQLWATVRALPELQTESKSTVGKGENHAAMAGSMSVQHICSHRHTEPLPSGSNLIDPDAERTRVADHFINPVGNAPGHVFRFVPCAGFCPGDHSYWGSFILGIVHGGGHSWCPDDDAIYDTVFTRLTRKNVSFNLCKLAQFARLARFA